MRDGGSEGGKRDGEGKGKEGRNGRILDSLRARSLARRGELTERERERERC